MPVAVDAHDRSRVFVLTGASFVLLAAALGVPGCVRVPPLSSVGISVPYEVDTLDPHVKNTVSNFTLLSHVYEPLVNTDADMKLRPCLARLWENPDPSTWIFHLQRGARFHSGRPLRAQDVVYSIRRLLAPQPTHLEMSGYTLYVSSVEALDDQTVRLRTTKPLSILLNKLRFVAILPEGALPSDLAERPDGTGPYTVQRWDRGRELVLGRHRAYWGPPPALDEVRFRLDRSPEEAADDIEKGSSQLAQVNSRSVEARLRAGGQVDLMSRPSLFTKFIGYDVAREVTPYAAPGPNPFRNPLVRQAMHLGIDRRRLVSELSTGAVPTNQLVPASIFGFNPMIPPAGYDPDRARALLRQAGLTDGLRAILHVRKMYTEAAHLVAGQVRPLGMNLEVEVLTDEDFLSRLRRRDSSLYLSRFGCPTGDASDILDNALHTRSPERHMGMQNFGGYSNAEVDRDIEASASVESVTDRRTLLEGIMKRLVDDLAWIPLYVDEDVYAVDRRLAWSPRNDSFILAAEIRPR
jgi:peptide/nickel transport system substrate-binding protein